MTSKYIPEWLINVSDEIIEHMNKDHSNSIVSTLHAQHGIKDKNAQMSKLEVHGFYAKSKNKLYFLKFEKTCGSLKQYKTELIRNAKKYRDYEI